MLQADQFRGYPTSSCPVIRRNSWEKSSKTKPFPANSKFPNWTTRVETGKRELRWNQWVYGRYPSLELHQKEWVCDGQGQTPLRRERLHQSHVRESSCFNAVAVLIVRVEKGIKENETPRCSSTRVVWRTAACQYHWRTLEESRRKGQSGGFKAFLITMRNVGKQSNSVHQNSPWNQRWNRLPFASSVRDFRLKRSWMIMFNLLRRYVEQAVGLELFNNISCSLQLSSIEKNSSLICFVRKTSSSKIHDMFWLPLTSRIWDELFENATRTLTPDFQ